jgi:hypothetical protein
MCTSLQDIWNDEYAAFKVESTKMRFFRLFHLYGLISSFVSIFLDSHIPIIMSLDIITLVGSLISLYLSRLLRLKESIEGKRASSLRLATFGLVFHSLCFFLGVIAWYLTLKVIILLVWIYHMVMGGIGVLMVFYKGAEILYFKFCSCCVDQDKDQKVVVTNPVSAAEIIEGSYAVTVEVLDKIIL